LLDLFVDHVNTIVESNESDNSVQLSLMPKQSGMPELAQIVQEFITPIIFDFITFCFSVSFNVTNLSNTDVEDVKVSLMRKADEFNSNRAAKFGVRHQSK
jgi:subtilase family serine protease